MKKILLAFGLMLSFFASNAADLSFSEIDMLVGQTIKLYPAGTHLNGFAIQEGDDFAQVTSRSSSST